MSLWLIEEGIGTIDGANRTFFTTTQYLPGSVRLYLNGLLYPKDCIVEIDAATKEVRVDTDVPPRDGDEVHFGWIDQASVTAELTGVAMALIGKIEPTAELAGRLQTESPLRGSISGETALRGVLSEIPLRGNLSEETRLFGLLRACDE